MSGKLIFGLSLLLSLPFSCQNNTKSTNPHSKTLLSFDSISNENETASLMINNCYSCHTETRTSENKIAPSMQDVKSHYINTFKTKGEFVKAMTQYVNNPTIESATMHNAITQFGIMPNMQFNKADVSKIVNYLYDTTIDTEEWTLNHKNSNPPILAEGDYIGLGRHIVMSTKKILGKNLKQTIKNKGVKEAVSFCNLNAVPILDSMKLVHHAKINRVTNKARNQNNIANELENEIIHNYQTQIENGKELSPILNETGKLATFYMPIVTNQMCIKCHGYSTQIDKETYNEINRLYPKDMAIGYIPQQIRGLWRVVMEK